MVYVSEAYGRDPVCAAHVIIWQMCTPSAEQEGCRFREDVARRCCERRRAMYVCMATTRAFRLWALRMHARTRHMRQWGLTALRLP